jgi:hypothetical protein
MWSWLMDNPTNFKKVNGWMTCFWIVMVPVSLALGWLESVTYVSALSIYALITGHLSTWQAARVEERQDQDMTEQLVQEIKQTQEEEAQTNHIKNGLKCPNCGE